MKFGFEGAVAGGYYSKFIGKKFIFQGKAQVGIGIGIGGNIDIKGDKKNTNPPTEVDVLFLKYDVKSTWVAGCGASLTMMMVPTLALSLYTDYKYANPQTKITISDYYQNLPDEDKLADKDRLPTSALSVGLRLTSFF